MEGRELLRLVAVDVDGCLSGGESQPIDLGLLGYMAELNDRSRQDPLVPAITFITGRSAQYVEVIQQLTRGYLPAIYEVGSAALLPQEYRFLYNPILRPEAFDSIRQARDLIWSTLGKANRAYYQPGLELTISVYPIPPVTMEECGQQVDALMEPYQEWLKVERSRTCIDILPREAGKATGLHWLADLAGVPFSAMAGIGDSPNDGPFLELVAFSGAPANAHPEVKGAVDHLSPWPEGRGVRDFLERCLEYNQGQRTANSAVPLNGAQNE
jgi:hypothetical protein